MNIALGSSLAGAPLGTWCFIPKNGIDLATVTVVASVVKAGDPRRHRFALESARWVLDAPDCSPNQIEVQTFGYAVEGGNLVAVPNNEIAFSFLVV